MNTHFRCLSNWKRFMYDAGVTGQQMMLTPPRHLILPLHLPEVCPALHSILYLLFEWWLRFKTNVNFAILYNGHPSIAGILPREYRNKNKETSIHKRWDQVHSNNIYIFGDAQADTNGNRKWHDYKILKGSKQTSHIYTFSEINTRIHEVNKGNAHTHSRLIET
jgi:hypothetical protein